MESKERMQSYLSWAGADRGAELARGLRASQAAPGPHDLVIMCCGHSLPAHRAVVAAASPLLATLLREHQTNGEETAELCWPDMSAEQAVLVLQYIYCGQVEGLGVTAAGDLVEAAGHLQVIGLLPGHASLVASLSSLEDDVFIGPSDERPEDIAMDLSPVNRHPPVPINSIFTSRSTFKVSPVPLRRAVTLASSDSLFRSSNSIRPTTSEAPRQRRPQSHDGVLQRIKKPKPLTNIPKMGECSPGLYLKPKTPKTPLLASPDCHVLEEKLRHFIEGKETDPDKLRNLSVSSADFNYDPTTGSIPGTPNSGIRHRTFNFPEHDTPEPNASLDLSMKRSNSPPPMHNTSSTSIPTIHVVKPEPDDSTEGEEESQHSSSSSQQHCQAQFSPKSEPHERPASNVSSYYFSTLPLSLDPLSAQSSPIHSSNQEPIYRLLLPPKPEKMEQESSCSPVARTDQMFSLPEEVQSKYSPSGGYETLSSPLTKSSLSPSPGRYSPPIGSQPKYSSTVGNPTKTFLPAGTHQKYTLKNEQKNCLTSCGTPPYNNSSTSQYSSIEENQQNLTKKQNPSKKRKLPLKEEEKQSFKCQKCGKCYNWNYNLNRHMRFECGIENRFECAMCHKRFPYKQNAAIHLKRKHKLPLENADDMISAGHISLLPVTD